ncbi:trypsin-like peptidase domain-containing protein [Streptomyces paludis]|uniref:trypsin-like peptidase domain-containing protein n=1 Tax=Streptomyces paludis TaxID=2282738 RepID=UPI0013B3C3CD|nr:trypsin-like peptidase domain-containing protein [Streptomyces paludis]
MTLARVVAVLGASQGTGVLLTPRLVLTCAHVLGDGSGDGSGPSVAHPQRTGSVAAAVQWRDDGLDIAALITGEDIIGPELAAPLGMIRVGTLATESPLPHCAITGFPAVQRYGDDGALELDQYRATVLPAAGTLRSALVCELDHPAAEDRHDGTTPLAGLSGAPVFAGSVLLGVVTQVPRGRGHLRVEGVPMDRIVSSLPVKLFPLKHESLTGHHPRDRRFEEEYARAVRARYRKTRIFGIDELGAGESTWDLDTAYLSLEAGRRDRSPGRPRRIEELLTERPRTLLRGEAGAGKTTLVWWLAAHAACGTLGPELAGLNGLVPFVVPLRTLHARGLGPRAPPRSTPSPRS